MLRIRALEQWVKNIRIREKLLLAYLLGGVIPILLVIMYNNTVTKKMLMEQTMESELAELSLLKTADLDTMRIVSDVSKRIYFNKDIQKIAFTKYKNYEEIMEDYRKCTAISDYLNDYYQEINSISVYLKNETISSNANFIYADESIRNEMWYKKTIAAAGNAYWSYFYDPIKKKKSLRLTRVLYTEDLREVGVLSIVVQNKRTELSINQKSNKTALVYNNEEIVHANFRDESYFDLIELLAKEEGERFYKKVKYHGEEYYMAVVRMQPEYSKDYYSIVSISPSSDIRKQVNLNSLRECLPFLGCIMLSICLITIYSNSFSKRVNTFRQQMHKAAAGDFDIEKHLGGKDEIGMLYDDLNVMIQDIQKLMQNLVQEKVQKEKLNARQKEVQFKMLASQINPHFLYNTLETIRMKALVDKEPEIADLAKMLAKIMRRNIQISDRLVTLESEIQLIEYYLKIQYYRFSDRIHSEICIDDNVDQSVLVVPLIIQPLVENAFIHGLESKESQGELSIHIKQEDALIIMVKDNGCGISKDRLVEIQNLLNDMESLDQAHIGISNVNQRIRLRYGEEYGLKVDSIEGKGTLATVRMPIVKEEKEQ